MYRGVREFTSSVPPQVLLDVVWDVAGYPAFVKGIKQVDVLESHASPGKPVEADALARFRGGFAGMEFEYVLRVEREPREVRWQRVSGAFKDTGGRVTHLGGDRFRYEAWLDPGFHAPEFAVRFVLERSLPRLIREFCERAEQRQRAAGRAGP